MITLKKIVTFKAFLFLALSLGILQLGCGSIKQNPGVSGLTFSPASLTSMVDPYIGSGGNGHVFVGANVPFGAVQLGPTNITEGWDWCSGYHYSSNNIVGFSHTHLSGTGIGDLGDILVMPTTGDLKLNKGTKQDPESGYLSLFSHENETVRPGYYSVLLDKYKVKAELTATERVGFHRYTFPEAEKAHIILDLAEGIGWDSPVDTYMEVLNDSTLIGYRFSKGWADDQRTYFAARFSIPLSDFSIYDSTGLQKGNSAKGKRIKGVLNFKSTNQQTVLIKVGISPVSSENALLNMNAELPHWDFNKTAVAADQSWENELKKVEVKAGSNTRQIFYTALYHSMIAPSLFNDHNGDYRGADKKVYEKASFTNLTTFSLWDTYRAAHPLYTILQPERVSDMVQTMLNIYKQTGWLPIWHLQGSETGTMVGYHAVPPVVDAYLKGIRGIDSELAFEAIKKSAMGNSRGLNYVKELGYIPAEKEVESVAKALEYAIDDWCVALMAKKLGKQQDFEYFSKRSQYYRNYFDKETGFMRGKLENGKWRTPFNPVHSSHRDDDYTEGNAWQYTWLVPQDPNGLIDLLGGDEKFTIKLDSLFLVKEKLPEGSSPDISGLIGQYAQGNEPGHHIPYLFSFAGKPWKTAQKVRTIMDSLYTTGPKGLCGNEDVGQMSSWYIFSAMGFYPVNPANGMYVIGSPALSEAIIRLPGNKQFKMTARNNSSKNIYIQKATLNGIAYTKSYLTHKDIMAGGVLILEMGDQPSLTWGVMPASRPYTDWKSFGW